QCSDTNSIIHQVVKVERVDQIRIGQVFHVFDVFQAYEYVDGCVGPSHITVEYGKGCFIDLAEYVFIEFRRPGFLQFLNNFWIHVMGAVEKVLLSMVIVGSKHR
ncbi:MAG: hypothetical protein SCL54_14645, partial [Bacillota bacterium]|nr:hypothetical protein [Bacillota bacterium]